MILILSRDTNMCLHSVEFFLSVLYVLDTNLGFWNLPKVIQPVSNKAGFRTLSSFTECAFNHFVMCMCMFLKQ